MHKFNISINYMYHLSGKHRTTEQHFRENSEISYKKFDFLFVQCHKINTVKVLLKMTTNIYHGNAIVSNFQYAQCFCLQF